MYEYMENTIIKAIECIINDEVGGISFEEAYLCVYTMVCKHNKSNELIQSIEKVLKDNSEKLTEEKIRLVSDILMYLIRVTKYELKLEYFRRVDEDDGVMVIQI